MYIVAIVGIEGSGKTPLTKFLAEHYQTAYAIEYGDFYCQNVLLGYYQNEHFFTKKSDYVQIVQKQQELWKVAINESWKYCFFDTDLIFTKYFIDKQFYQWNWIDTFIGQQPIDLFIFLENAKTVLKPHNIIKTKDIHKENAILLSYYKKMAQSRLIVVKSKNHHEQKKEVLQVLKKWLPQTHQKIILNIKNLQTTAKLADIFAQVIKTPATLCLYGELGVGKTQFSKFFGHAVGVQALINSPSFTKMHVYQTVQKQTMAHFDGYHLKENSDFGVFQDYLDSDYVLIEWPKLLWSHLNKETVIKLSWYFTKTDKDKRTVVIEGKNDTISKIKEQWEKK